jgi:uncharacterized protein
MMADSIMIVSPADVELTDSLEPITPGWILSGNPVSRMKTIARSYDWTTNIDVWECDAGSFKWHFSRDEVIFAVSGEAFMLNENGGETRFGAGDVGFFRAGTCCTFRVPVGFRKVAVLREPLWQPIGFVLKVWNNLLRTIRPGGKSSPVGLGETGAKTAAQMSNS